jgi:hypothetical protein
MGDRNIGGHNLRNTKSLESLDYAKYNEGSNRKRQRHVEGSTAVKRRRTTRNEGEEGVDSETEEEEEEDESGSHGAVAVLRVEGSTRCWCGCVRCIHCRCVNPKCNHGGMPVCSRLRPKRMTNLSLSSLEKMRCDECNEEHWREMRQGGQQMEAEEDDYGEEEEEEEREMEAQAFEDVEDVEDDDERDDEKNGSASSKRGISTTSYPAIDAEGRLVKMKRFKLAFDADGKQRRALADPFGFPRFTNKSKAKKNGDLR